MADREYPTGAFESPDATDERAVEAAAQAIYAEVACEHDDTVATFKPFARRILTAAAKASPVIPAPRCETCGDLRAIADELRALGEEWRSEWPDGRVCKADLNRIADNLTAVAAAVERTFGAPDSAASRRKRSS